MKTHSTNYQSTFIEVAEDCPANSGQEPPQKGDKKSVANQQYELLKSNPYKFTSDDLFFTVFAARNEIGPSELKSEREKFFSKGQPCFRASPLTKRYGWGVHSDENGKVALYGLETEEYQNFVNDESIKKVKAMKMRR
ncbi:MAG: DUF6157 family protein [Bacteroidota bacterium]